MQLITQHLCLEKDVGANGNLFGGFMMAWLDEAAAILAFQSTNSCRMVTLLTKEIKFIKPVKVGDIIQIKGKLEKVGRSSVTIKLKVNSHNPETKAEASVCETSFVFVKIDEDGNKQLITEIS
ncbi:MAG: acyl-CoA thioesterase [Gammaproteobacteria bacterium]|nr:acyl-CoA thioesterase [Gammaproteobacteria bacterium]